VAGLLSWSVTGCSRDNGNDGRTDFFPLHDEDLWIYGVAQPLRNLRTRMTVRVRGERYIEPLRRHCLLVDETYGAPDAALAARSEMGDQQVHPIAYCRKDGFLYRALSLEYAGGEVREIGLGSAEERFLPDSLVTNAAWESVTTAYDLGGGTGYGVRQRHNAVREARPVEVPAGRFSGCVRVETVAIHGGRHEGRNESNPIVLYYADWYAPNIGLVRTIQSDRPWQQGQALAEIELLAYDVEGAER
jgi:hypothetical protein